MARTPTHPPTDRGMWRRLLARAHPDAGGTHELFIWTGAVRDAVCNERLSSRDDKSTMPRFNEDPSRVPFDPFADLEVLTDRALAMAAAVAEPYGYLLRQVTDCYPVSEGSLRVMQAQAHRIRRSPRSATRLA